VDICTSGPPKGNASAAIRQLDGLQGTDIVCKLTHQPRISLKSSHGLLFPQPSCLVVEVGRRCAQIDAKALVFVIRPVVAWGACGDGNHHHWQWAREYRARR